ncbi:MAG TPA: MoaD/ThiS family protein [Verrucomicrobiae bacterium]|nr:MoaD/ThiS family protein [Verrucomicrobiae bacterium]
MRVNVTFYSYFRDLTGCSTSMQEVPNQFTLGELQAKLIAEYPRLGPMQRSTLMAVGVDYQPREYVLREGDEISLFPPVQGG